MKDLECQAKESGLNFTNTMDILKTIGFGYGKGKNNSVLQED